jgi:hypothetical protein
MRIVPDRCIALTELIHFAAMFGDGLDVTVMCQVLVEYLDWTSGMATRLPRCPPAVDRS